MIYFKDIPGVCAWCSSEEIDYQGHYPIFDGDFVKFNFICKKCGRGSIELFQLEFVGTKNEID